MPSRSHTRVPSNQYSGLQNGMPRRPGLAPLALGSERNRSNSESILQSTQANKSKRQGLIRKRPTDLGIVDETRPNRNSTHLRGQSHGSALRNGIHAGSSSPSDSPGGDNHQQDLIVRRLTSVSGEKQTAHSVDSILEGARSVLYACHLIHPSVSKLIDVLGDIKTNKPILNRAFRSAVLHLEHLDQGLSRLGLRPGLNPRMDQKSKQIIAQAARECLLAHQEVATLILQITKFMTRELDPRYLRTLMYTLSNSMHEIYVACNILGVAKTKSKLPIKAQQRVSTINEAPGEEEIIYQSDRSVTPTQRRKPERRWGNSIVGQHSTSHTYLPTLGIHTAASSISSSRSRSNSHARPMHSSTSSSIVSTPRSGESFSSTSFSVRSRSGSTNLTAEHARVEKYEAAQFGQILSALNKSIEEGFSIIPLLQKDFLHKLENKDTEALDLIVHNQLNALAGSTSLCLDLTQSLRIRLSMISPNDREARNAPDLWQLAKGLLDSYTDIFSNIKMPLKQGILSSGWKHHLRPFHQLLKEAIRLIHSSPWEPLTRTIDTQMTPQAIPQPPALSNGYQHRPRGSGGSTAGGSSPYPSNIPATPLSAALGVAAQATIPSAGGGPQAAAPPPTPAATVPATPGTASLERSFEGDVFQRAETLAQTFQQSQTIVPRRII